jgi:hypothetical protein
MKIQPIPELKSYQIELNSQVRDRGDKEGGSQNQQDPRNPKKQKPQIFEVTEEKLEQAMGSFQVDTGSTHSGLTASLEGKGPGLRVLLKDGTGAVIRQFTGEEFLKLRVESQEDGRKSGKIIDRKL